MAKAYLLSLLSAQRAALADGFRQRFPHAWLVWEPGRWNAPSATGWTRSPSPAALDRPADGDALCFSLGDGGAPLWVGRAEKNDIVINDATVSREHVRLQRAASGWTVTAAITAQQVLVRTEPLAPGKTAALRPGDEIRLGDVTLTFHDSGSLGERLDTLSALKTRPPGKPPVG